MLSSSTVNGSWVLACHGNKTIKHLDFELVVTVRSTKASPGTSAEGILEDVSVEVA